MTVLELVSVISLVVPLSVQPDENSMIGQSFPMTLTLPNQESVIVAAP